MQDIHAAAVTGDIDWVKPLLSKNVDADAEDETKSRPIHFACQFGHFHIVELLLSKNCNIEAEDSDKWRPIHYACYHGHVDIVELLLSRNCNIESKTPYWGDVMSIAFLSNNSNVMELLWSKNCSIEWCKVLIKNTNSGSSPKCQELLQQLVVIEKSLELIKQSSLREQKVNLIKMQFIERSSKNIQSRICKDISDIIQIGFDSGRGILNKLLILICLNDSRSPMNGIMDSRDGKGKYFVKQIDAQRIVKKEKLEKKICCICYSEEINGILGCGHCYCMSCIDAMKTCPGCMSIAMFKRSIFQR